MRCRFKRDCRGGGGRGAGTLTKCGLQSSMSVAAKLVRLQLYCNVQTGDCSSHNAYHQLQ